MEEEHLSAPPPRAGAHRAARGRLGASWGRLPFLPKIAASTVGLVLLCWGGFALVGVLTGSPPSGARTPSGDVAPYVEPTADSLIAPSTGPAAPTTAAADAPTNRTRETVVETRTVIETRVIDFQTRTVKDNSLAKGSQVVRTPGVPGVETLTYEVTFTNGVPTAKKLVRSVVTAEPVTEVVAVGTMPIRKRH